MNQEYVVKKGDTLWGISNQYGVSVTELAELNNVDASSLKIGQVLLIPIKAGVNPDNMFMYTVKKGDSLYSIAKVYGTSVNKIKELNYLKSDLLSVGQVLRIPENYINEADLHLPSFISYTVKKGDTLYGIANKYGLNVSTVVQDNGLKNYNLSLGQILKIRQNNVVIEECFGNNSSIKYTVVKGDTLYSIAKKYNISVNDLISKNNLNNTNLSVGQVLII